MGQNDDMDEILLHPFFADVDIEGLLNKKVTPPFIPKVKNKNDLANFDPEVTQQHLAESILPPEAKQMISQKAGAFDDFGPTIKSDDTTSKKHSSGESAAAAASN